MSYMRGACGVSRWDRESNEDMYRRFGMSETAVGMDCGVVEWVKIKVNINGICGLILEYYEEKSSNSYNGGSCAGD